MRPRRRLSILIAAALMALAASAALAQFAQPTPGEAEVGPKPAPSYPEPRSSALRAADLAVFAVVLVAGTAAIVRYRSRRAVMALLAGSLLYFGFWRNGCVCPVGAIQNVSKSLADPGYTISIFITVIFLLPIAFALVFGRVFCGTLCPLGAVQEWINPTRFHLRIPRVADAILGWLRWVYLAAAVWLAIGGIAIFALDLRTAPRFIICALDPFVSVFRAVNLQALFSGASSASEKILAVMAVSGWGLTLGALALSVVVIRPYCRWLCPYGAVLGLCSRAAKWPVRLAPRVCAACGACDEACPVNAVRMGEIDPSACVACGRCHAACPALRSEAGRAIDAAPHKQAEAPPPAADQTPAPRRAAVEAATLVRVDEPVELGYLDGLIQRCRAEQAGPLALLMGIQAEHGYLPPAALEAAADRTGASVAELLAVSSFYNLFRHEPRGEHLVSVCHGTACHVAGAQAITDALRRRLEIAEGRDTDAAGKFTIEKIGCLGCCSLAPVMQVDGRTYGHLTAAGACEIIEQIAAGRAPRGDAPAAAPQSGRCACESAGEAHHD